MPVGVFAHTIVSAGHRARAASSVVYSPTRGVAGAPGAETGADCFHHGNSEPDWEAGAGAGAGAGAEATPPDGAAPEPWRVRHCERNCGQVWPPVVPAALASFHWPAHSFMTLWPAPRLDACAEGCDHGKREPD